MFTEVLLCANLEKLRLNEGNPSGLARRGLFRLPEQREPQTETRPRAGHRLLPSPRRQKRAADDASTVDDWSCSRKRQPCGLKGGVPLKRHNRCHSLPAEPEETTTDGVGTSTLACAGALGDDGFELFPVSESGGQDSPEVKSPSPCNLDGFMAEILNATELEL
ncbi:uncharacterized protein LOC144148559 [Haemaphysalis longicornis]